MLQPFLVGSVAVLCIASLVRAQDVTFVDGTRLNDVRVEGRPWKPGRGCVESRGAKNRIYSRREIGPGNFAIRARLTLDRDEKTRGSFTVGKTSFPFTARVTEGKSFEFEARRAGSDLSFAIDGNVMQTMKVGAEHLGVFGFTPGPGSMRLHHWSFRGTLRIAREYTPDDVLAIQPQIDNAIDTGVAWLLKEQNRDGSWNSHEAQYRGGITALCTYTLLKAGLSADHPGVERALAFLSAIEPDKTYSAACFMLAFGATSNPKYRDRMKRILAQVLRWQRQGSWGYPHNRPDLSNTQYAALALRAAHLAGLEVPKKAFLTLMRQTMKYQESERRLRVQRAAPKTGKGTSAQGGRDGKTAVAGFSYVRGQQPTGSMTTAGVSILTICEQALGEKLGSNARNQVKWSVQKGVEWLGANFAVDRNPKKGNWILYYLYGLERVGSLLGIRKIGGHDWYYEGAQYLIQKQNKNGSWRLQDSEPDTCFAVLFLRRATMIATGVRRKQRFDLHIASDGAADIQMRGSGLDQLSVWITGFGKHVRAKHKEAGLRIQRVEYLVDGKVVATVQGTGQPWKNGDTFPTQHKFARMGDYQVSARAFVTPSSGDASKPEELTCKGFVVRVPRAFEEWMRLVAGRKNLLRGRKMKLTATTQPKQAKLVTDGLESTAWVCHKGDKDPTLTIALKTPVRANAIVLSQANGKESEVGKFDRVTKAEIRINRKPPIVVELEKDELKPTMFDFGKLRLVSKVQIRIVGRVKGRDKGRAGFSEIVLLRK